MEQKMFCFHVNRLRDAVDVQEMQVCVANLQIQQNYRMN